jgi:hypothetical protein
MKRVWKLLAVGVAAIVAGAGCGNTNTTFQLNTGATLTFLSPANAQAGGAAFTLTVNGTGFASNTIVQWSGSNRTTTFVSATQVTAAINTSDIATAGRVFVQTVNPNPSQGGNGLSNALAFEVLASPSAASAKATAAAAEDSPSLSGDGRMVAYTGANGEHTQIYLHDSCAAADPSCRERTTLISAAPDGTEGDADSRSPAISASGRFVAFSSAAGNLVQGSAAGKQIFLRDTCFGADASCRPATQLISTDPGGALTGTDNLLPAISSTGRFVAFLAVTPDATNGSGAGKSAQPNSGLRQVFVRDTCFGAANCTPRTIRISTQPGDAGSDGGQQKPALSGDAGRLALSGRDATLFAPGKAVDDSLFLVLTTPR